MADTAATPMPQPAMAPAVAGGQLPSPRSPALSCADMILPEPSLRSFSPSPYMERPPSPPNMYAQPDANRSTTHVEADHSMASITLAAAPRGRRDISPHVRPSPTSSRSSRSTLRNGTDANGSGSGCGTPQRIASLRNDTLASSSTIADGFTGAQRRGTSTGSGSDHSDDLENITWPQFDGPGAFNDDSGVVLEEDEDRSKRFSGITDATGDLDNERWLDEQNDSDDKEENSAALSRRAEMILANAKKRLNVMEGNLRGARQSLVVSPTLGSRAESALSFQLAASRERDRRLYAGQGPIPPRRQSYMSSPLAGNSSPGHSRGMSETSVPAPLTPGYTSRIANKRASSAMALSSGPWAPENYGQGRFPIRESRSWDTMADNRNGWSVSDERSSSHSHESRGSASPHNTLETLPEDDDTGDPYLRPSSTTGDLKAQMQDLRGRISSLKQKAKEDTMRRRSLQTLRTSSPFTNAESWYTGSDAYKNGGSPVAANAGLGIKTESPVRKTLYHEGSNGSLKSGGSSETAFTSNGPIDQHQESVQTHQSAQDNKHDSYPEYDDQNSDDGSDSDFLSVIDDANTSVYEDAVYEHPVTERHEDRADAFDYEHFFLHSAMGTYSSGRRGSDSSSSASSADSVETTRPTTAVYEPKGEEALKRISMHQRNASMDSVSSVATFATAAEELEDEEEEANEQMERFSETLLVSQNQDQNHTQTHPHAYTQPSSQCQSHQQQQQHRPQQPQPRPQSQYSQAVRPSTSHQPRTTPRSHSALNLRTASSRSATSSPFQHAPSRASSSPASDIAAGLQISKIYSILLGSRASPSEEPRLALSEEEKQLVYALAASFQGVVSRLQGVGGRASTGEFAGYERKELRRRLDAARRVLDGLDVLDVLNGDDEEGDEAEDVF